jgi:hypothetical protein
VDGINYSCRAWVNFNGTGTVAIRGSGNVTSITDNGVGDYTVNFTTAMADTNFAALTNVKQDESNASGGTLTSNLAKYTASTSSVRVRSFESTAGSVSDVLICNCAIFR